MSYYCEGQDIKVEFPTKNKIIIFIKKGEDRFLESCKCFGTHYLEQTLDDNNDVISEVIKENPHWVDIKTITKSNSSRIYD